MDVRNNPSLPAKKTKGSQVFPCGPFAFMGFYGTLERRDRGIQGAQSPCQAVYIGLCWPHSGFSQYFQPGQFYFELESGGARRWDGLDQIN